MKTIEDLKLENTVHSVLVSTVKVAIQEFVSEDRDAEDGVWPDLSDHLEAVAMNIIKEVEEASN